MKKAELIEYLEKRIETSKKLSKPKKNGESERRAHYRGKRQAFLEVLGLVKSLDDE
jgi:hypothetical protein